MTTGRLTRFAREEFHFDTRALLGRVLAAPLPAGSASRVRARLLRVGGLSIGDGTLVMSTPTIIGGRCAWQNLVVGARCFINQNCVFDATAPIIIGDDVNFGEGVLITTSAHRIGTAERRAGLLEPEAVRVGHGAWVASRAVVLPGIEVGAGAIVCAGAVVTRSVAANTMVAGVPARELRRLDGG